MIATTRLNAAASKAATALRCPFTVGDVDPERTGTATPGTAATLAAIDGEKGVPVALATT